MKINEFDWIWLNVSRCPGGGNLMAGNEILVGQIPWLKMRKEQTLDMCHFQITIYKILPIFYHPSLDWTVSNFMQMYNWVAGK